MFGIFKSHKVLSLPGRVDFPRPEPAFCITEEGCTMRNLIYRNNIYELRTGLGISQDRMAGDLNISRRSISKIECGEQNPSLEIVYRISAYFDRNIPEVFPLLAETHLASYRDSAGRR